MQRDCSCILKVNTYAINMLRLVLTMEPVVLLAWYITLTDTKRLIHIKTIGYLNKKLLIIQRLIYNLM